MPNSAATNAGLPAGACGAFSAGDPGQQRLFLRDFTDPEPGCNAPNVTVVCVSGTVTVGNIGSDNDNTSIMHFSYEGIVGDVCAIYNN